MCWFGFTDRLALTLRTLFFLSLANVVPHNRVRAVLADGRCSIRTRRLPEEWFQSRSTMFFRHLFSPVGFQFFSNVFSNVFSYVFQMFFQCFFSQCFQCFFSTCSLRWGCSPPSGWDHGCPLDSRGGWDRRRGAACFSRRPSGRRLLATDISWRRSEKREKRFDSFATTASIEGKC